MISRRLLLAIVTALVAEAALPQKRPEPPRGGPIRRIGYLSGATEAANVGYLQGFRAGMADRHWREGKDYELLSRYANGTMTALPALAQELVALRPDVILAPGYLSTKALAEVTRTVPIVFLSLIDPVGSGLVASLSRPGGNMTGYTDVSQDLSGKRVQLLREAIPKLSHLAVIFAPGIPTNPPLAMVAEEAATAMGIRVTRIQLLHSADVDTAVRRAASAGAQAFIVFASGFTQARRSKLVEESIAQKMPGIFYDGEFVENGGFMSYATSTEIYGRVATIVDKILHGANPGDLPVEQPTSFELMINLKTALAIGVAVPNALQLRADRVFQ